MDLSGQSKSFSFLTKLGHPPETIRLWTKIFHPESITGSGTANGGGGNGGGNGVSGNKAEKKKNGITESYLSLVWITHDQRAFGFGCNNSSCLGLNRTSTARVRTPASITALKDKPIIKLVSGCRFAVALTEHGRCYSWGDNRFGQLGLGRNAMSVSQPTLMAAELVGHRHIVDVVCGLYHTILLDDQMDVYAFGSNVIGAVGNGTTIHQNRPFRLASLVETHPTVVGSDLVRIAAGGWHSAAVNLKGDVLVWGCNQDGQCCQKDFKWNALVPVRVPCTALIRSVRCGMRHTLALGFDGTVWAFGSNDHGQCAQPVAVRHCLEPVRVFESAVNDPVMEIGAWAKSDLSVARTVSGTFYIWGAISVSNQTVDHFRPLAILAADIVDHPLGHWDVLLSHLEPAHLPDDYRRYGVWPFETELITAANHHSPLQSTEQLETLNQPTECDLVFCFHQTEEESDSISSMIFVQRDVLETTSSMLHNLPADWRFHTEDDDEKENVANGGQELVANKKLTVNKQNRTYLAVSLHEWSVFPSVLYGYLVFLCSGRRFTILTAADRLFDMVCLADKIKDLAMINECLGYLSRRGSIQQICQLYARAMRGRLDTIQRICLDAIKQHQNQLGSLFEWRETTYDLEFIWTQQQQQDDDDRNAKIRAHKLILVAMSRFYHHGSAVLAAAFPLNHVNDYRELCMLDHLIMPPSVAPAMFELYLYRLYHGRFPADSMDLDKTCRMIGLMVRLGDQPIQRELELILPAMVNEENVCQFYLEHCLRDDDDGCAVAIFRAICMDRVVENLPALIFGSQFERLLAADDPLVIQTFFRHLRQHCINRSL